MPLTLKAARNKIIIALDYPDLASALHMAEQIGHQVGMLKVGLELFNAVGVRVFEELHARGMQVFYDAKLHDIPNTVAGAAAAAARQGIAMINVHALGGRAMMEAAQDGAAKGAAQAGYPPPLVIAVTVLTSLGDCELQNELGFHETSTDVVLRFSLLAKNAGLDGVVCAVHEVREIKRICGKKFITVTPGIRPSGAARGDQARIATPGEAVEAGADYLVIGRPVTGAANPSAALDKILQEMMESG